MPKQISVSKRCARRLHRRRNKRDTGEVNKGTNGLRWSLSQSSYRFTDRKRFRQRSPSPSDNSDPQIDRPALKRMKPMVLQELSVHEQQGDREDIEMAALTAQEQGGDHEVAVGDRGGSPVGGWRRRWSGRVVRWFVFQLKRVRWLFSLRTFRAVLILLVSGIRSYLIRAS